MASSSARTLDSRPTTKGVIIYGKITTSRMGIIGRRFVSDFSLIVSMFLRKGSLPAPVAGWAGFGAKKSALAGLAGLF